MAKKYVVDLNEGEKADLVALIQKGRSGARKIKRANILLLANAGKPDIEIAELLQTSWLTVLRTRHRFVEGGLDFALNELPRAGRLPKIDVKIETILTTLAQSQPPDGRVRWTLQLLADRLVALTRLESLSYEAVRLVLKKTVSNPGSVRNGVFPLLSVLDLYGGWKISWICTPSLINQLSQSSVLTRCHIRW
jgi:transposase